MHLTNVCEVRRLIRGLTRLGTAYRNQRLPQLAARPHG